jgi:hypothetical protein
VGLPWALFVVITLVIIAVVVRRVKARTYTIDERLGPRWLKRNIADICSLLLFL